jgi:hypothetical protein
MKVRNHEREKQGDARGDIWETSFCYLDHSFDLATGGYRFACAFI